MLIFLKGRFKRAYLFFKNTKRKKESLKMIIETKIGFCSYSEDELEYQGYSDLMIDDCVVGCIYDTGEIEIYD